MRLLASGQGPASRLLCILHGRCSLRPLEVEDESVEDVRLIVDDECRFCERAGVGGGEGFEPDDSLIRGLLGVFLDGAEHDARADRGEADLFVACLARRRESRDDDRVERALEIVDDEHDILELSAVHALLFGDDRVAVLERQGTTRLVVEHLSRRPLDHTVDPAEPRASGVDGGEEGIGLDCSDVALDEVDGEVTETE